MFASLEKNSAPRSAQGKRLSKVIENVEQYESIGDRKKFSYSQ